MNAKKGSSKTSKPSAKSQPNTQAKAGVFADAQAKINAAYNAKGIKLGLYTLAVSVATITVDHVIIPTIKGWFKDTETE